MRFITFTGKESFRMKLESDDRRYSGFSNYAMRGLNIENNFLGLLDVKTGIKGNIGRFGEI